MKVCSRTTARSDTKMLRCIVDEATVAIPYKRAQLVKLNHELHEFISNTVNYILYINTAHSFR